MILIFGLWLLSLQSIPKESSPQIKFGIVQITTTYIGANPVDIDTLITEEIEQAIDDLEWIKKYSSISANSVWITTIELENDVDTDAFVNKVRTAIANVNLPEAADDPKITELSTESDRMFNLLLYGPEDLYSVSALKDIAQEVKDMLITLPGVSDVTINGGEDYEIRVIVPQTVAEEYGLTASSLASILRGSQQNIPLGSYTIDSLKYDFTIQGQLHSIEELLQLPIRTPLGITLTLGDIATIERKEKNEQEEFLWLPGETGKRLISLTIFKASTANIFDASTEAKTAINNFLTNKWYTAIGHTYSFDLSELIKEDYGQLSSSALQTIILVMITMLFFVWWKPSFIAAIWLPMGFMITFIVLDTLWYTLNFLTNFSLVLTLGIAIDTTIVIIEAAAENLKLWYNPKTAVLFAVKNFKNSIIAGTMTTVVVFIPMMLLPGVIGKFLAYIPITVFATLIAILFIALTVNSALFYKLNKKQDSYIADPEAELFMTEEEQAILAKEREGKTPNTTSISRRQRVLMHLTNKYEQFIDHFLSSPRNRRLSIFIPLIGVLLSFFVLSPRIWFTLFPDGDNGSFSLSISSLPGTTKDRMHTLLPLIEPHLQWREELKQYSITLKDNSIEIAIDLSEAKERQRLWQRDVFEVEKELLSDLEFLVQDGYTIASVVQAGWPPQGKPVWVKLTASSSEYFTSLIQTAKQIEDYLKKTSWTKNPGVSSPDTPGQFVVQIDTDKVATLWLSQAQTALEIAQAVNGVNAGEIKINGEDRTIKVLYDTFARSVTPESIASLLITVPNGQQVRVGDLMDIKPDAAVAQISRENGKISVRVESDLADGWTTQGWQIQGALLSYMETVQLPEGISFEAVGEWQENAELISATVRGFIISLAMMFMILLIMFNSLTKPAIILYAIILAFLWVNIGLAVTGNPYSMPFAIGFIALAWIVVNDAIILLERIRENVSHKIDETKAIVEAGKSRLQPILLTTITTVFGILPLALQDEFWAWLGYTIIFGLIAGSSMTLFVIPSLYFELMVEKKPTRVKTTFRMFIFFPVGIVLFLKRIWGMVQWIPWKRVNVSPLEWSLQW